MNPYKTHGAFSWSELMTTDPDAAVDYYSSVFGWDFSKMDMGDQGTYHVASVGGKPVGGIMERPNDDIPVHWGYYITVDDVDETVARIRELGGKTVVEPFDAPGVGRMCPVQDPQGAHFNVITGPRFRGASGTRRGRRRSGRHGARYRTVRRDVRLRRGSPGRGSRGYPVRIGARGGAPRLIHSGSGRAVEPITAAFRPPSLDPTGPRTKRPVAGCTVRRAAATASAGHSDSRRRSRIGPCRQVRLRAGNAGNRNLRDLLRPVPGSI